MTHKKNNYVIHGAILLFSIKQLLEMTFSLKQHFAILVKQNSRLLQNYNNVSILKLFQESLRLKLVSGKSETKLSNYNSNTALHLICLYAEDTQGLKIVMDLL